MSKFFLTMDLETRTIDGNTTPFLSIQCRVVTALKGGGMLGDALPRPTFPLILLRHLCIFLLIIARPWNPFFALTLLAVVI